MIYYINEVSNESINESIFNFGQEVSDIFHECEMNIINERYNFLCENGYETQVINENAIMNAIRGIAKKFKEMWDKIKKWFKDRFIKIKKVKSSDDSNMQDSMQDAIDGYKKTEELAQRIIQSLDNAITDAKNNNDNDNMNTLNQAKETFKRHHETLQKYVKYTNDKINRILDDAPIDKEEDKRIMKELEKSEHELDDLIDTFKYETFKPNSFKYETFKPDTFKPN